MGAELSWFPEDVAVSRLSITLASLANSAGGHVLLGIAPRSREVHGVRNISQAMDVIFQAALLVDPPLVLPMPAVVEYHGKKVISIHVPQGLPHVYSVDSRYYGREGSQYSPLTARRLRQLLMERGVIQFESRPVPGATLDDLNSPEVQAYLEKIAVPGNESWQQVLLRRGCLVHYEGELVPTYAGLLLFGCVPQQWLPSATILLARFSGPAFADEFMKQEAAGSLPQQLAQAEAFLRANLRSVVRMSGLAHLESTEYPFEAVRELLVNAVAHRDYNLQGDNIHAHLFSNRLEIHSPGGLPGPVTLVNLLDARFARNAVITQVLSDLGYVERLGYGLDRVVSAMRQYTLRPPRFEELAGTFRVTLYNDLPLPGTAPLAIPDLSAYQDLELNPRQKMALVYAAQHKRISSHDFQELCPDVHSETLRRDLSGLVDLGVLIKVGDKRATYYILKKRV
jgi:ATP-dependent DNA helicase RecG